VSSSVVGNIPPASRTIATPRDCPARAMRWKSEGWTNLTDGGIDNLLDLRHQDGMRQEPIELAQRLLKVLDLVAARHDLPSRLGDATLCWSDGLTGDANASGDCVTDGLR
jgi:hypothetical protein